MGRKTQVTKEEMLKAGLEIVIEEGENMLSIKKVAAKLECSTQPISWSFGNFDAYRKELKKYALDYMNGKMKEENGEKYNHTSVGYVYIDTAINEPNLIRYLRSDEAFLRKMGGIGGIFLENVKKERADYYKNEYSMSSENAEKLVIFFVTFTEGIVSLILSGVLPPDEKNAAEMLTNAATVMIKSIKG